MYFTNVGKSMVSLGLLSLFALSSAHTLEAQSRIRDKVSRNNGADFFANQRTSRSIDHARDYSRSIQRYATQAPAMQTQIAQAESQMLGQQLQGIQRDLAIVRQENASDSKVIEQVKKMETQLDKATLVQKSLHEECCKASPDAKVCAEKCKAIMASLDALKKDHDALLKQLGQEEASHAPHGSDQEAPQTEPTPNK